ncbi:hypothetical protein M8J75_004344 [Diaphorina citri]|nr:hypothetical protein M8J75_004344 [Diaphorina citri]
MKEEEEEEKGEEDEEEKKEEDEKKEEEKEEEEGREKEEEEKAEEEDEGEDKSDAYGLKLKTTKSTVQNPQITGTKLTLIPADGYYINLVTIDCKLPPSSK